MKKFLGFILFALMAVAVIAQDSTRYEGQAGITDVADSDPGLFMFMMFMLCTIVLALIFTLILAMIFWMLIFLMAVAGIASLSVFIGWYQKSVRSGLLWFVILFFGLLGAGGGMLIYFLVIGLSDWTFSLTDMFIYAVPAGLVGGMLAGWLILLVMKRVVGFVKDKVLVRRG